MQLEPEGEVSNCILHEWISWYSQRVGRLQSLDWTGGLDRWTGLDWTGLDWNGLDSTQLKVSVTILQLLESGYLLTYLCNFTQSCILLPSSACPYR